MHSAVNTLAVQGNLILTDADYNILTLLRSHFSEGQGFSIQANRPYPIRSVRPFTATTPEALQAALQGGDPKHNLKGRPLHCHYLDAWVPWNMHASPLSSALQLA